MFAICNLQLKKQIVNIKTVSVLYHLTIQSFCPGWNGVALNEAAAIASFQKQPNSVTTWQHTASDISISVSQSVSQSWQMCFFSSNDFGVPKIVSTVSLVSWCWCSFQPIFLNSLFMNNIWRQKCPIGYEFFTAVTLLILSKASKLTTT